MLVYIFVLFAFLFRFFPHHPFGFTPVAASLLFFGAYGARRQFWVPLALFIAGDVILTKLVYIYPFTWDHYVSFAWYAGILWLGTNLRRDAKPLRVVAAALTSSVSFFIVSNFAVWAAWQDLYPKTVAGLATCYAAGLPFFQRSLAGDLLFTCTMFATPVAVRMILRSAKAPNNRAAAV